MSRVPLRMLTATGLMVVLAGGALAGCFSKHEATAPSEGVCSLSLNPTVPGSTIVVIRDFLFGPADLTVRIGDRVTWINCDVDQHTTTADGGQWASPLLSPGEGFTQTFTVAGEFTYHCEPHPFMTARVIVQ
jgi:plastocyanin